MIDQSMIEQLPDLSIIIKSNASRFDAIVNGKRYAASTLENLLKIINNAQ